MCHQPLSSVRSQKKPLRVSRKDCYSLLGWRIKAIVLVIAQKPTNRVFLRKNITLRSAIRRYKDPERLSFSRCRSSLRTQIIKFYVGGALLRGVCDNIEGLINYIDLSSHPEPQKVYN